MQTTLFGLCGVYFDVLLGAAHIQKLGKKHAIGICTFFLFSNVC